MPQAASEFILWARRLDLQAMQHQADRAALAERIGQLVHCLQAERGATSIFLASGGRRFATERGEAVARSAPAEQALRAAFGAQLRPDSGASAPMMAAMGGALLDLDNLLPLRAAIALQAPRVGDAVAAFSRVIAGLIELVFVLAEGATDPASSHLLVALVHLLQVKEAAGQERAVGAQLLASGACTDVEQQRFIHLIDAQERAAAVLLDFIDADLRPRWDNAQGSPNTAHLERLRRGLCMVKVGQPLDAAQSQTWFEVSSQRIADLAGLEADLVLRLQALCAQGIARAQQDLVDTTGLVQGLHHNPSPHVQAVDRYFSDQGEPGVVPVLTRKAESAPGQASDVATLQGLLAHQSARLAQAEQELRKAKQTIHERKVIERAKGVLMSRLGLSEDAAYRALQKAAMDHNKRLLDVAESTLTLVDIALGAPKAV